MGDGASGRSNRLPPRPDRRGRNDGVGALVVGISSVVLFFPFGPLLGPIAIVLGRRARREAIGDTPGGGLGTAGIVLGVIGSVAGVFVWVAASTCDCL